MPNRCSLEAKRAVGIPTPAILGTPAIEQRALTDATDYDMKIRTLIVDDQLMAREMLRRMLKDEPDIEIVAMPASGQEAVEAILRLKPDLVFLDVQMPEL